MEPLTLGILLIVGLVSGFINTLAGGGSMLGAILSVRFTIQTSDAALRRILFIMVVLSCFSALFI